MIHGGVCEQDTMSTQATKVSSFVPEFAIGTLYLLPNAMPAGIGTSKPTLLELSGVEVVEEQHAWYMVRGTWRCVCEQDTVSIHVIEVSILVPELDKGILHLLFHAVPAGMDEFELEPCENLDSTVTHNTTYHPC